MSQFDQNSSSSIAPENDLHQVGVSLCKVFADVFADAADARAISKDAHNLIATSCTSNWRQVQPGDVFVAVGGNQDDGHDQAREAVRRGAKAIVCERPVPVFDVPTIIVDDSRVALGSLCQALVDHPTRSLPTIGVTGTQGKTTVVALLDSIFTAAGRYVGSMSDLGCFDGMTHSPGLSLKTTPAALASRLARMSAAGCTHAVAEVSSRALAQFVFSGIQLDAVCVTNVTSGHLDFHHTTQNYRDIKRRILKYLSPDGVAILCADDPVSMSWLGSHSGPVLTYGLGSQAEITGSIVQQHANEQLFVITAGSDSAAVRTTIVGDHHVINCLGAAATALSYGIDLPTIARGIEALERLPCRMERVDCGQGFPVFVDVARTPDALQASLRTAKQLAQRRVICVLGEEHNRVPQETELMHRIVSRMADVTIIACGLCNYEPDWTDSKRPDSFHLVDDRNEAIACAVAIAEQGDVVVIAGSQTVPSGSFGRSETNDAEVTRELLYARNREDCRSAA